MRKKTIKWIIPILLILAVCITIFFVKSPNLPIRAQNDLTVSAEWSPESSLLRLIVENHSARDFSFPADLQAHVQKRVLGRWFDKITPIKRSAEAGLEVRLQPGENRTLEWDLSAYLSALGPGEYRAIIALTDPVQNICGTFTIEK